MLLARSFVFHLLAPYTVHLLLALLLLHLLSGALLWVILVLGGWVVVLVGPLLSIPFGVLHLVQTIRYAPGWRSPWRQFLIGLLNPSLAILTIAVLFYLAPELMSQLWSQK